MSGWFSDLDPMGSASQESLARANPTDTVDPAFSEGGLHGAGMGIMRGGAKLGRAAGMAGAVVPIASDALFGTQLADRYFEGLDELTTNAVDHWTPNAREVGSLGQTLGGLGEIVFPLMAGGGNPAPLMAQQGLDTPTEIVRKGGSSEQAVSVGLLGASTVGLGFKIPAAWGNTLAQRAATGAASNVALGVAQGKGNEAILADKPELAAQYGNSVESATVDAVMGAAFGAITHAQAPRLSPTEVDAMLVANNAQHFQTDAAPGRAADMAANVQHQQALETAVAQLMRGESVNVADAITEADFVRRPVTRSIVETLREQGVVQQKPFAPSGDAPRGIRNNNPGNLERSGVRWQGEVDGNDMRFETFATPEAGIRALARNLVTYHERHGLTTVESIINRWAPPGENQTGAYVRAVAEAMGVSPDSPLNLRDVGTLSRLTTAIIHQENGQQPYSTEQIRSGVDLALSNQQLPNARVQLDDGTEMDATQARLRIETEQISDRVFVAAAECFLRTNP